jgi:hypothetical protein
MLVLLSDVGVETSVEGDSFLKTENRMFKATRFIGCGREKIDSWP